MCRTNCEWLMGMTVALWEPGKITEYLVIVGSLRQVPRKAKIAINGMTVIFQTKHVCPLAVREVKCLQYGSHSNCAWSVMLHCDFHFALLYCDFHLASFIFSIFIFTFGNFTTQWETLVVALWQTTFWRHAFVSLLPLCRLSLLRSITQPLDM